MSDNEPDFFSDAGLIADPKPYFERLRSKCPVLKEPHKNTLMVTGREEIIDVFSRKDDTFSSAAAVIGPVPPLPFTPEGDDITEQLEAHRDSMPWSAHLACYDGKKHADYRGLLVGVLTAKRIKQNEDYLYGLVDRIIDRFIANGRCNVVPEFAHAVTTYAISDLMGIPEAHRAELLELIGAPPSQLEGDAAHKVGPDPLIFMKERFDQYLKDRQAHPTGDLLSDLANARLRDGSVPPFDVISCAARFLFGAGQDTTSRLIAMAIKILGEDQALQERVRRQKERIPDFIEEVLRYDPPVKTSYRIARKRTTVAGVDVPAGTIMTLCLTAGNHDPRYFEHPEKFDMDRPRVRDHVSFGRGAHGCLGAPLGRLESRIAIERLLARTAQIRISEEHHGPEGARRYRFEPTYAFRSLSDLYIEFTAGAAGVGASSSSATP